MSIAIKVFPDTYIDSVVQLRGIRAMREISDVEWASAAMATPANIETLRAEGVDPADVEGVGSNDLFIVARARDEETASKALTVGEAAVLTEGAVAEGRQQAKAPRSLREALRGQPESNVAVVSVPGDYAALAAYQALSSDLHVLLFSDNVPLPKEIALKDYALSRGRLVMGPGAGTAVLGATGLGFANAVRPGPVGVVAAAGTGAQEAMALLDRWGWESAKSSVSEGATCPPRSEDEWRRPRSLLCGSTLRPMSSCSSPSHLHQTSRLRCSRPRGKPVWSAPWSGWIRSSQRRPG